MVLIGVWVLAWLLETKKESRTEGTMTWALFLIFVLFHQLEMEMRF